MERKSSEGHRCKAVPSPNVAAPMHPTTVPNVSTSRRIPRNVRDVHTVVNDSYSGHSTWVGG